MPENVEYDYDWATFMTAYAAGRWDPHRTPNPPRSTSSAPLRQFTSKSNSVDASTSAWTAMAAHQARENSPTHSQGSSEGNLTTTTATTTPPPQLQTKFKEDRTPATSEDTSQPLSPFPKRKRPIMPPSLPSSAMHALRSSMSDLRLDSEPMSAPSNPGVATAAATMRWAAERVNIAPLALPSPEHELTDPMRGVTATIPGSQARPSTEPMTPGGTRRKRMPSFWKGTQDIEDSQLGRLATIEGSPSASVDPSPQEETAGKPTRPSMPFPASAPLVRSADEPFEDYFGGADYPAPEEVYLPPRESPPLVRRSSSPIEGGSLSVPAVPRRISLARQISSPLPESTRLERYSPGRVQLDNKPFKISRAAKEEQMYIELGYLAPPNPPDEWERRRALNK